MGNHNQKRHLSQFFTPQAVVEFMFDLVGFNPLWKVMDPACGDGIFLKEALKRGALAVAGMDIDADAIKAAQDNLRGFEGRFRLFCQDGLAEIECENGFWKEHYDLVIGNPPFASSKYRVREKRILQHFTLAQSIYKGKEYRIENAVKDGKEGCWVYWGKEDKVWWEPKPWHTAKLKEIGPAYYDIWTQPGLNFPWNDPLKEREKYTVDQVVVRGINAINMSLGCPDYADKFVGSLLSPKGKLRVKHGCEWNRSNIYYDYGGKYPEGEGKLKRKYAWEMTYPEDVSGMGGINYSFFYSSSMGHCFYHYIYISGMI